MNQLDPRLLWKYGMPVMPLPQNWQSAAGQEYIDALLAELNKDQ
jgi:hypothetical protein